MSNNDHSRNSDTVMAAAFRKAGYISVPPDDPKANSHMRRFVIRLPGVQCQPAFNFGSPYTSEIDLHECSEDQAYEQLEEFLKECVRERYRTVLVITGKGYNGSGKLKRLVPLWLEEKPFKEYVAESRVAASWDGGDGALYVHLREC